MQGAKGGARQRRSAVQQVIGIVAMLGLLTASPLPAVANDDGIYGAYGPQGPRLGEQLWMLPSGDPARALRATVFRPDASEDASPRRLPLVVINHGTSDLTRLSVSMPVFYWLSRWFVDRGYVVVLPQRRGHGATGGPLAEAIGNCSNPDHFASGQVAADDIEAVTSYMSRQPFVSPDQTVVVGISTGGWASLALASRNLAGVRSVINFSGGRGGHAGGRRNAVCGEDKLIEAAAAYGKTAKIPTAWFYSRSDSYFGPELAQSMAEAWNSAGGLAALHLLPPYGQDGHDLASDRAGWDVWGDALDVFLNSVNAPRIAAGNKGSRGGSLSPASLTASK